MGATEVTTWSAAECAAQGHSPADHHDARCATQNPVHAGECCEIDCHASECPNCAPACTCAMLGHCGYRLAAEPEPCGMRIELDGGTWRHVYRAVDRDHAAVREG